MSREKIQRIIDKRKPLAQTITEAQSGLAKIVKSFRELRGLCRNTLTDESLSDERKVLEEIFASFDMARADELSHHLENIRKRLSRDTLNIAVIGRARQGKSRLLRTITGLTEYEIPDYDGPAYTGVRSDIVNDPEVPEGDAYAYIDFMSEDDFMDNVVCRYFRELKDRLPGIEIPATIEDFEAEPLPDKEQFPYSDRSKTGNRIDDLQKLKDNLHRYRRLLAGRRSKQIPRDKIRSYVVQYEVEDVGGREERRPLYAHYAVDKAEIHCRFENTEAASLRLIDLPGLGDTTIGYDERMIQALSDQVDLVLFVTMPSDKGTDVFEEDLDLYSKASSALGEKLPIDRWAFWVINHKEEGDNLKQCGIFEDALRKKHVDVAKIITVNCMKPDEVTELLIEPALDFLEANIERNDREYAASLQAMMNETIESFRDVLARAGQVFSTDNNFEKDSELFDTLFDALFDDLIDGLAGSVEPDSVLGRRKNEPCTELMDQFDSILRAEEEAADRNELPGITPEVVRRVMRKAGSPDSAYSNLMHQLRTDLSAKMQQELDATLERVVLLPMKEELCRVLAGNGKLGLHFKAEGAGILREITDFIEDGRAEMMRSILDGLKRLDDATISCQNRIQPLIREALNILDPMEEESRSRRAILTSTDGIYTSLVEIYSDTLAALREGLDNEEIYSEPNEFAFAVADNFVDDLVRRNADISSYGGVKIDTQWRALYRYIRADIWPSEFGNAQAKREAFAKLRGPITSMLSLCGNISLSF